MLVFMHIPYDPAITLWGISSREKSLDSPKAMYDVKSFPDSIMCNRLEIAQEAINARKHKL